MIEKTTQQGSIYKKIWNEEAAQNVSDVQYHRASSSHLEASEAIFEVPVLGNENDDGRFFSSCKTGFGDVSPKKDKFVVAAERQRRRQSFKESGLRTYCWGRVIGYDMYRLSDKFEHMVPGSRNDKHVFFVRVEVWQDKEAKLEFTQEYTGNWGMQVKRYLRERWGITLKGQMVPIRFSHRHAKWQVDLSKKPLAINSKYAKPPLH